MKNAQLIDISAVFFRYYFAPGPVIINDDGWDVAALLFSLRWLCQDSLFESDITIAAFDESLGTGFRHQLDEDYKANRVLPTDDIIYQLTALKTFCEYMGFCVLASDNLEADDLIGAASVQLIDYQCVIRSRDKDLRQLICTNVIMQDLMTDKIWDLDSLKSETNLSPDQVPLYLALMGDSSDNIVGLPGIGDKTARALLLEYGNWNGIKEAVLAQQPLPVRGSNRISQTLIDYHDLVEHNLKLTRLKTDDAINFDKQVFNQENLDVINALAQQFGIHSKLKKALNIIGNYTL